MALTSTNGEKGGIKSDIKQSNIKGEGKGTNIGRLTVRKKEPSSAGVGETRKNFGQHRCVEREKGNYGRDSRLGMRVIWATWNKKPK